MILGRWQECLCWVPAAAFGEWLCFDIVASLVSDGGLKVVVGGTAVASGAAVGAGSVRWCPMSWILEGRPALSRPQGREMAGASAEVFVSAGDEVVEVGVSDSPEAAARTRFGNSGARSSESYASGNLQSEHSSLSINSGARGGVTRRDTLSGITDGVDSLVIARIEVLCYGFSTFRSRGAHGKRIRKTDSKLRPISARTVQQVNDCRN